MPRSQRDTDEREVGARAARALRDENSGNQALTRAAIGARAARTLLLRGGGRTQRELGKVRD